MLYHLSEKERVILTLLEQRGELCGQELVTHSRGELGRGTVYVTLARMIEKTLISSRQEKRHPGAIGLPRRMYKATALGTRTHEAVEAARALLTVKKRKA